MNIFEADIKDDVSAKTEKMAASIEDLIAKTEHLGTAFKKTQTGALNITLKDATKLFKSASGNITLFKQALKAAGVSEMDTAILTQKLTGDLEKQRRAALGMNGIWAKVFDPKSVIAFNQALEVGQKAFSFFKNTAGSFIHGQYEKAKDLVGEVIESAQLRQDTLVALKDTIKGTAEQKEKQAEDLYMFAAKAAALTPLDTDYIIEQQKELLEQGYSPDETKQLVALISDQQSEFKGETGHFLTEALTRMKSRGYITNRDFESLRAAKIPMEEVYVRLAKELGISTDDKEKAIKLVRKQATKGNVSLSSLLNAVMDQAVAKHGALGTFSIKNSETLTGALSNFKNAFGDLLKMGDPTKWKGLEVFTNFLVRAQRLITDQTGVGGRLLKSIEYFINSTLGGLEKITDKDITTYLDSLAERLRWAGDIAKTAWEWLDKILHAGSFKESLEQAFAGVREILENVGRFLGQAIAKGAAAWAESAMFGAGPKVQSERGGFKTAGGGHYTLDSGDVDEINKRAGVGWFKRKLGGLSNYLTQDSGYLEKYLFQEILPEDAFGLKARAVAAAKAQAGVPADLASAAADAGVGDASQLMSVPRMAGGGYVDKPTLALIGERGPERVVPAGSGGSSYAIDASINIGGMPPGTDVKGFADMLTTMQARKLTAALERLSQE